MPYGEIKVDTVTFTNGGSDQTISVSGIVASISGNITATGTISGDVIRGGTTVSGATVTGTAGQFGTITGGTAGFTTVTGTTVTGTTANFVTVSGTTVTGATAQFTTLTGGTAGFTTITGTTVTGTTANFVTVSGTTVTGNVGQFTTVTGGTAGFTTVTGTTITGTTLTVASGTFSGNSTAAAFIPTGSTVPTNGVYLPAANSVAVATNGTGRLFVDASGNVGIANNVASTIDAHYGYGTLVVGNGSSTEGLTIYTGTSNSGGLLFADGTTSGLSIRGQIIYDHATDSLAFATAANERARIDSSGRLLVGTSSSVSTVAELKLQIEATDTSAGLSIIRDGGTTPGALPNIRFARSRGTTLGSVTAVADGDGLGGIIWHGANGTDFSNIAGQIACEVDGQPFTSGDTTDLPGRLVFSTTANGASTPTEAMRINSSQNVILANGKQLFAQNTTGGSGGIVVKNGSNNTSTKVIRFLGWNDSETGSISTFVNTTAYTTSSDYRLKENIAPVIDGLARFKQLNPCRFNFTDNPGFTVDGFIAHEVQEIVPEAIVGEKDEVDEDGKPVYQGIDQSKLVPLLTAALQEAVAKIETLEARLTAAGIE